MNEFCENLAPNSPCPHVKEATNGASSTPPRVFHDNPTQIDPKTRSKITEFLSLKSYDDIADIVVESIFDMKDLIVFLAITAITVLVFIFGYYCIKKCQKESPLISNVYIISIYIHSK